MALPEFGIPLSASERKCLNINILSPIEIGTWNAQNKISLARDIDCNTVRRNSKLHYIYKV
jgi:hypothetical protein